MKKQYFILAGFLIITLILFSNASYGQSKWTESPAGTIQPTGGENVGIAEGKAFMQAGNQVLMIYKGAQVDFYNTYVGKLSGSNSSIQTVFGFGSGFQSSAANQSAFGYMAGLNNIGADQSVFGNQAGFGNTAIRQAALGFQAGVQNEGAAQTAFGYLAGSYNKGESQAAFGNQAGINNEGNNQTAFGVNAGKGNTGHNSTMLGFGAGGNNSGNNSVFIGHDAGLNNTENNQFIVRHSVVNPNPLILGNFDTGEVRIQGKITTQEVEVTATGWPDFVFADDYELMGLADVEHYIAINRHLPSVPNEAEIMGNGVKLGEMSAILLQKIEELTLYVIALNKQNEELQERLSRLEK